MNHLLARTEYHKQEFYSQTTLTEDRKKVEEKSCYCILRILYTGLPTNDESSETTVQNLFSLLPCIYGLILFSSLPKYNIPLKDHVQDRKPFFVLNPELSAIT